MLAYAYAADRVVGSAIRAGRGGLDKRSRLRALWRGLRGRPVIARRAVLRTGTVGRDVPSRSGMSSWSRPCTGAALSGFGEAGVSVRLGSLREAGVSGGTLSPPFWLSGRGCQAACGGGVCLACGAVAGCVPVLLPCSRPG
jgi:hypothetical protein